MNITMNSPSLPVSGDAARSDAVSGAAPADALPLDPALAAAQAGVAAPLPFLQFMQMDAALPGEPLPEELAQAPLDAAAQPAAGVPEEGSEGEAAAQAQLAAMNMPLMPSMMAMPAALPAAVRFAAGAQEQQGRQERAADAVPAAAAGAVELPLAGAKAAPAFEPAGAQPARAGAAPQQAALAAAAAAAAAAADGGAEGQPAAGNQTGGNAAGDGAGFGIAASAAPQAAPRDGGSLTLSGPPTAWRQSLQEALGERLNLQLGKNAEQAVIRLEPPMLGRVEISIRHAAGSLEVNITATHSEVLRQLNTVSENLRSDLAQRQYTDVSVNVSQATQRAQAAAGGQAGAFGADTQGRRQQGQEQDERAPGAALAEANQSTTAFSLGGRA